MGLETGNFVADLVATNPVGSTDFKSQGDNHLRLIKAVLQATFPNASRAFRFEEAPAAKVATYEVVAADQRKLITVDVSGGAFEITFEALSNMFAGWVVTVMKVDSSSNAVTLNPNGAETINGQPTYVLNEQYEFVTLMVQNGELKIIGVGNNLTFGTAVGDIPVIGASGLDSAIHGNAVPVGTVQDYIGASAPTGWLLLNGDTIGSTASAATQNSDNYEALFALFWNSMADTEAPVSGGRGASAAADWAANKTLTMPDARGRTIIGSGTGSGLTARTHGAAVGAEGVVLTIANLPSGNIGTLTLDSKFGSNQGGANGWGIDVGNAGSAAENIVSAGSDSPVDKMQPSLALNKIIRW